jgi:selenocysteine lyase/cysteine desulfurase
MGDAQPGSWDCDAVRKAFPVLKDVVYLNVGTYGLMPEPALKGFVQVLSDFEQTGVASSYNAHGKANQTRARIAALMNADPEEIAFTRNATDGIALVTAGMEWQAGDEVITTSQEHEAIQHPLLYLQRERGVRIRTVEVAPEAAVMLPRLEAVYSPRTRLVAMSHVTCETGTRLPAQEICAWAAERNVLSLMDGAQALGVFPLDMRAMGCDFYTSNGHKWMSGPKGTGIFYVRRDKVSCVRPAHVGAGTLEKADFVNGVCEPWMTAARFEFGTRAWALYAGLGESLDWFEKLGWSNVEQHVAGLAEYLRAGIVARPYLRLLTPRLWRDSSGLTSFVVEGRVAGEVSQILREKSRIFVRVIPHYNAIRIATAHFNCQADIDTLFATLDALS